MNHDTDKIRTLEAEIAELHRKLTTEKHVDNDVFLVHFNAYKEKRTQLRTLLEMGRMELTNSSERLAKLDNDLAPINKAIY